MRTTITTALMSLLLAPGVALAASQCSVPLSYSITTLDPRFAITRDQLAGYLAQAEQVWEAPSGHDLFSYRPLGGTLAVNLVYDYRQADTDSQKQTLAKLTLIRSSFDLIQQQFSLTASSTIAQQETLAGEYAAYKTDEDAFNADVAATNASGGAAGSEYQMFLNRENELKLRFDALKARETELNGKVARLNALSDIMGQLVTGVNAYIARYNAALQSTGDYEEGVYRELGSSRAIEIYQYADTDHLVRALAHELGHALGMGHVSDSSAIMFPKNQGSSLSATTADIAELDTVCGF